MRKVARRAKPDTPGWLIFVICLALFVATWLVYGQTLNHQFVNYDDQVYVYENPVVSQGLTWAGLSWVFTHSHGTNWHPLTSITHLLDSQFYGLNAGGHHFTNVLLHSVAALAVFLVLRRMTGKLWRSAFVAALFALHPLHVESVAWISERKDVLSALFFALTLGAYVRYCRAPSLANYLLVAAVFVLGLMSKPMLVTLPILLLLLDYWPLRRFQQSATVKSRANKPGKEPAPTSRLILEKVPLLLLSIVSCVVTSVIQRDAMSSFDRLPISLRTANAAISYVIYLREMAWPSGLAAFYPYPGHYLPLMEAILSVALLLVITLAAYFLRRRFPYFITGWLWYVGMLVPVIGLVQVGSQAHADRYTYLPQIGLYLAIAWAAVDLSAAWRYQRRILALAGLAILTTFSFISWRQVSYWRDSESLWTRSLAVTQDNALAHRNLGGAFLQKGMVNDAIAQHQIAVDELGEGENSIATGKANSESYLAGKSDRAGAIARYVALVNLAHSLFQGGRIDEAIRRYQEAMQLLPDHSQAYNGLGTAYLRKGMLNEAIKYFEKGLEVAPDSPVTENNLAWILAARPEVSLRDGSRAVDLAKRAEQATAGKDPVVQHTLAAAYAANQQFTEAILVARKASDLATEQGKSELSNEILRELSLYQAHQSYREAP